jgi:hypothetical protein
LNVFTFDPFAIIAVIVGLVALVMAIKRDRRRPVPLSKEVELTTRIVQLEHTVVTLQRLLYEKQTEIDVLTDRVRVLEKVIQITDVPEGKRLVLLAGIGDDAMLEVDLAALRKVQSQTNLRLSRLLQVEEVDLKALASLVESDMALAAAVMKAVSSACEGLMKARMHLFQLDCLASKEHFF